MNAFRQLSLPEIVDALRRLIEWGWEYLKTLSAFLKPYADVMKPMHDIGVVTVALLFGLYQFVSKRTVKSKLDRIERALSGNDDDLWLLHKPEPFREKRPSLYHRLWVKEPASIPERDTKYVIAASQKGGVGKTTIAANLAAFMDKELGKDVILVDLDYQGSLSNMMLLACGITQVRSDIDNLFDADATGADVLRNSISLEQRLSRTWLISAFNQFRRTENRLMLRWLIEDRHSRDIRHALAQVMWSPEVRRRFDIVIFDAPPRFTMGTVAAIAASTHVLIPTGLDKLSAEAVGPALATMKLLKAKLNPQLKLLGVIGNLSRQDGLNPVEEEALGIVRTAFREWDGDPSEKIVFERTLPRRQGIIDAAGEDIAYLTNEDARKLFDALGREVAARLWPQESERRDRL
jgi:chromosome partitioning protein